MTLMSGVSESSMRSLDCIRRGSEYVVVMQVRLHPQSVFLISGTWCEVSRKQLGLGINRFVAVLRIIR